MGQLTQNERRERNADKLKTTDLWITGDGTPFPATDRGLGFARKWARRNGLSVHYERKTKSRSRGGSGKSQKEKTK